MHYLKTFMEEDIHIFLARQILLYLPLADILECKLVSGAWNDHIQTLFGNESTRWANAHLAHKTSAAMSSVVGGAVVQNVHLDEKFDELTKRNYRLMRCYPFKGFILLHFEKIVLGSDVRKYWFGAVAQDNIHCVRYALKYACTLGCHFQLGDSFVNWWYVFENEDSIKVNFKVIEDLTSFCEKSYEKVMHVSDFVSPTVAYHELISGDSSLRSDIQIQFPERTQHFHVSSIFMDLGYVGHEILYYKRPTKEASELWVLNIRTMKVEIKRSTTVSDWICNRNENIPFFVLMSYRPPYAAFYIKTSNTFAVWNLCQPGRPRHIGFDIQLPLEPLVNLHSKMSRSKWIIGIYNTNNSNFVYMDPPSAQNSSIVCECSTDKQVCLLEKNKLNLKATLSSHTSMTLVHFVGERIIIEGTQKLPEPKIHIRDCWKAQCDIKDGSAIKDLSLS